jgi:hypothetical protein
MVVNGCMDLEKIPRLPQQKKNLQIQIIVLLQLHLYFEGLQY